MENIVRKGEVACNKQFLLFSECFLPIWYLFFIVNALQNAVRNLFQFVIIITIQAISPFLTMFSIPIYL